MIVDDIFRFLREKKVQKFIPKNSIVCDLGCGFDPHFLKKIAIFIKKGFGFDREVLPCKNLKIEARDLDLEKGRIPLENESVEVVVMAAVIEHLLNPVKVIKEVFRILKSNGVFIATTPAKEAKIILEFLAFKLNIISKDYILDHKNYFSPGEIKKIISQSGFPEKNIKINRFEFGLNNFILAKK